MKKVFGAILGIAILFTAQTALAQAQAKDQINLYFFYGDGCPHCHHEAKFLDKLEEESELINIKRYEVWKNRDNAKIFAEVSKKLNIKQGGVPTLIIGEEYIIGYSSEETTGNKIKNLINKYIITGCDDVVSDILNPDEAIIKKICGENCPGGEDCSDYCEAGDECSEDCECEAHKLTTDKERAETMIEIPFFGEINPSKFSLPIITILIAGTDGFNPCAMWVLLFLISLLLGMENRRRMWILGATFILASGTVYFLFLSAWLNMFLFVGFVFWIRILVALTALGSGIYHLYDFYTNKKGGCKVTGSEKRRKIFCKLKVIAVEDRFWVAFGGIILIAIAVNLVELVCSAGLPAVYTQILAIADLPKWKYYAYLVFYILIFMLDDLLVFFIAMTTMQMTAVDSKYTKYAGLIGGVIMVIIGILLLFKPGLLMFG